MLILNAEDDPLIAMAMNEILLSGGHQVLGPANTMARAIHLAERDLPFLALLDINLRDGCVGPTLARHLSQAWGVYSIFVTASIGDALANQDAAFGLIEKPFTASIVLNALVYTEAVVTGFTPDPDKVPHGLKVFPLALRKDPADRYPRA